MLDHDIVTEMGRDRQQRYIETAQEHQRARRTQRKLLYNRWLLLEPIIRLLAAQIAGS